MKENCSIFISFYVIFSPLLTYLGVRACVHPTQTKWINSIQKKNEWHLNENHTQNQQIIDNHTSGGGVGGDGGGKKVQFWMMIMIETLR